MSEMTIEKAIEIVTFRIDFYKKYTRKDLLLFRKAMSPNVQAFAQGFIEAHEKLEKIISLRDKQIEILREALENISSFKEGTLVSGSFDEPVSAQRARVALHKFKSVTGDK